MSAAPDSTRFVLVRTSHPGNVGSTARAMKVMGFSELVLVAPRFGDVLSQEETVAMASGAADILVRARIVATLDEALEGVQIACATAMTPRDFGPPVEAPRACFERLAARPDKIAFVFGSERFGLSNEDVYRCHVCLSIPTNPDYGSLNLAQAVILLAYEWSKGVALASPPEVPLDPPAEHGEMEQLIQHFIRDLDAAGYFFPADRTEATLRTLRTALTKTGWSYNDIRMMHGIITILGRTPRPR